MLLNIFKTALRNFFRNKLYDILNLLGMATGVACAALIFLWVEDEVRYNSYYQKKDRLYTILKNENYGDGIIRTLNSTPGLMGPAMQADIPGIAATCRIVERKHLFSTGNKSIYRNGGYTDSSFFRMFSREFTQGNFRHAFRDLHSLVISANMAKDFFGNDAEAIGKTLQMDHGQAYVITGVMEMPPSNCDLRLDWVAPFAVFYNANDWMSGWANYGTDTYVELQPGASVSTINQLIYDFIEKRINDANAPRPFLFPMEDWRLENKFENGKQTGGRIIYVRVFTIIAWIILGLACINYMNLATARSEKRAREVGVRKALGAGKKWLILQFFGESFCMMLVAVVIAMIMIAIALPFFNMLVEKQIVAGWNNPLHIGALLIITLVCSLAAGIYPALYLSSFRPLTVFRHVTLKHGVPAVVRKVMVVLQFTTSIVLIISTIIIYQQLKHIRSRDIGYNKEKLLSVPVRGDMTSKFSVIRQELLNTGLVENAGLNSLNLLSMGDNTSEISWQGKDPNNKVLISMRCITPELTATMGLSLKAGRHFTSVATDSMNVIITESLARLMGPGSAVGKQLDFADNGMFTVVGVVNDYVYGDMYGSPDPVVFLCMPQYAALMFVRIREGANADRAVAAISAIVKKFTPGYPFEYRFTDEEFDNRFKSEQLTGKLSRIFSLLAIIISCVGLFGLTAYTTEQRTKEIGIRKVLGAGTFSITRLLSAGFLRLVFIATLIAFPLAWWVMHQWLLNYAYRISIQWWVFISAGFAALVIALITISFQSVKAAMANPVNCLRDE